jgi:hypothetical protein
MTVKHLAGAEMAAADALSRYVAGAATSEDHSAKIKRAISKLDIDHGRPHMS